MSPIFKVFRDTGLRRSSLVEFRHVSNPFMPKISFFNIQAKTLCAFCCLALTVCTGSAQSPATEAKPGDQSAFPEEKHLRNIRQLTFGGQNAEAYFSADDKYLIFQHQGDGVPCDQIYTIPVNTPDGKPARQSW